MIDLNTYLAHPMWNSLAELIDFAETKLEEERKSGTENQDTEVLNIISAITKTVSYYSKLKNFTDIDLLEKEDLDEVNNTIEQLLKNWQSYDTRKRENYSNVTLIEVRVNSKNLTAKLAKWFVPFIAQADVFTQLDNAYKDILSSQKDILKKEFVVLETNVNDLEKKAKELKSQIENLETDKKKFEEELNTLVKTRKEEIDKDFKSIQANAEETIINPLSANLNGVKQEVEARQKSLHELINATSAEYTSLGYGEHAEDERSLAIKTYILGGISLLASVVVLVYFGGNILSVEIDTISWQAVLFKLTITLVFSVISTVAIRIGSSAMYRSNEFKRQELELRSLFALIPEDTKIIESGVLLETSSEDTEDSNKSDNPSNKSTFKTKEQVAQEAAKLAREAKLSFFNRSYGKTWDGSHLAKNAEDDALGSEMLVKIIATLLEKNSNNNK